LMFRKYLEETRPKLAGENRTQAFIIGQRKEPMTAEDITKHIRRNYDVYTPRKVNCMTIRQSVITNLINAENDLGIVQVFAGHKYPSATEKYKQAQLEELKRAVLKYHPLK